MIQRGRGFYMVFHDQAHSHRSNHKQKNPMSRPKSIIIFIGFILALVVPPYVAGIEISDEPLELKILSAPPNIMFVLDNSRSMDWEFMTEDANGKFEGDIEYLYDAGDNLNGDVLSGNDRRKWKSQWAGHNRMFYNQTIFYHPWPAKPNASTSEPRSNPNNETPTFDLTAQYVLIGTISIKNAHYYVWDDADEDGVIDNLEVYLVNFDGGGRVYYQFNDKDNDAVVDDGELVNVGGLPAEFLI